MDWKTYFTFRDSTHHGKVCIKDTRIPMAVVFDNLKAELTPDEIVKSYPSLTIEAIHAVMEYAAEIDNRLPVTDN